MTAEVIGQVVGLALRTAVRGPMQTVENVVARTGGGLDGDVPAPPRRGVTFLTAGQWADVNRELATDLPWHTRRANVLLEATSLGHLIGRTIRAGETRIRVNAETTPCRLMDELHNGLRKALAPDCRGGVYGEVLEGGAIRLGDTVTIEE